MRGYPILRLILAILAFGLLGVTVWIVTHPQARTAEQAPAQPVINSTPIELQFEFLSPTMPTHYEVIAENKLILSETNLTKKTTPLHQTFSRTINYPPEGTDLIIRAHWPSQTPSALRIIIRKKDSQTLASKDFWGDGNIADVITLPQVPN